MNLPCWREQRRVSQECRHPEVKWTFHVLAQEPNRKVQKLRVYTDTVYIIYITFKTSDVLGVLARLFLGHNMLQ